MAPLSGLPEMMGDTPVPITTLLQSRWLDLAGAFASKILNTSNKPFGHNTLGATMEVEQTRLLILQFWMGELHLSRAPGPWKCPWAHRNPHGFNRISLSPPLLNHPGRASRLSQDRAAAREQCICLKLIVGLFFSEVLVTIL